MSVRRRVRQAGMSLIELMVGMAVGLIGITIISHLYITNEKYKRSTSGAGTAQVNGAIALYTLERDVRMAGFGLNHSGALGCSCDTATNPGCSPVQYYYNGGYSVPPGSSTTPLPPLTFAPIVIVETANQPDAITLLYGNDPERMLPGKLTESMPQPSSEFKVDGTAGYTINDMVLVTNGATCMMTQITQVQDAASHLQHNPGTSLWNPAGGGSLLPGFPAGANLFNLGQPIWRTYSVASNRLQLQEILTGAVVGAAPLALMDDIIDLQAEYGKAIAVEGIVDTWNAVRPTNGDEWKQVLAVRLAVLARSQNYEKPNPTTGICDATVHDDPARPAPSWAGGQFPVLAAVATGLPNTASELRCYKYKVFETVVPLRNMIWRPA